MRLITNFMAVTALSFFIISLTACQATTGEGLYNSRMVNKVRYVQTENIQRNMTDERTQELADEI